MTTSGGFSHPTMTRGRISVPERGMGVEFMFNPTDVSDDKSVDFGTAKIPGASHPVYQFASGGERLINFDLYLDADRGKVARATSGEHLPPDALSLTAEINFYRSLLYPSDGSQMGSKLLRPAPVIFTFGELFNGVLCIVKKANVKVTYWTPDLRPVRATVSMSLAEIVSERVLASDVFRDLGSF